MKSVIEKNFYKLSSFNAHDGFYGHESVNELIVSRLLDILQIPHTNYRLVHALVEVDEQEYTTWLCVSKDYRKLGETNVSLEIFHDLMREGMGKTGCRNDACRFFDWKHGSARF